ncbi:VanZ family protein [bacterium]|nr:VanZ family protein [bacterium]
MRKKEFRSWLWVILWTAAIFLSIPIVRKIQKAVSQNLGENFFVYFVLFCVGAFFIFLIYFLSFKLKIRSASRYLWLGVVAGLYVFFILQFHRAPAEVIHFLEYGLLGFFLFKALRYRIQDPTIYITATLLVLLVGTLDECFQWITPQRMWDFRDVGLNVLSGALFQLGMAAVIRPPSIGTQVRLRSLRWLSAFLAASLVFLGLCASNTPRRVAWYTQYFPSLSFLLQEEPMSEFGHKIKDPEIGVFFSRLSPKTLKQKDREKGDQYAQLLKSYARLRYKEFLKKFNPLSHPFLYEFRVHLFRRDQYFKKARQTSNEKDRSRFFLVAYKENLILEKYFSRTLRLSPYHWENPRIQNIKNQTDVHKPYKSPVSSQLFTAFREKDMWTAILILLAFLGVGNSVLQRKFKNKKSK